MDPEYVPELEQDKKSSKFYKTLRAHSICQDDPIPEWTIVHDVEGDGATHCICTTPILHQFTIENKLNGNRLTIGSECVKRWEIDFVCKGCRSPLGNITKRLVKKEFYCPTCKKDLKRRAQLEAARQDEAKRKLGRYLLFWFGKYYKKPFSQVIHDTDYVNYLLNLETDNKSISAFRDYVAFFYDVVSVTEEVQEKIG